MTVRNITGAGPFGPGRVTFVHHRHPRLPDTANITDFTDFTDGPTR